MSSHKIRTGLLAKKKFNPHRLFDLIHSMTPAQSSFFRECCLQALGKPPSAFWGKQKIWFDLPEIDKKTLIYMAEAFNHSPHITSHKLAENHKAAAGALGIVKNVVKFGEKAAEYGTKAYEVGKKVYNVLNKASTAISAAESMGVVKKDSNLAKMNDMFKMVSGQAGSGFRPHPEVRRRDRVY